MKVGQLQILLEWHWIQIDRSKRGPADHKAFLTSEGRKLIDHRKKDFEFLFLMKNPEDFDMIHYMEPSNKEHIEYTNEKVKPETIIDYQNKIGKTMIGNDVKHVLGFIGKYKKVAI